LSIVVGKVSRAFLAVSLIAFLGGCSTTPGDRPDPWGRSKGFGDASLPLPERQATGPVTPVVQANCPQVTMLDQNAIYSAYAPGGNGDPQKLLYQASFADVTRACTANETTMTVDVVAQGRIVQGPLGKSGKVMLPIVVQVVDGDKVISSQNVSYPVDLVDGGTQFIFRKQDVTLANQAGGPSSFVRIRLGFAEATAGAKKPARRR
jgi:hypothetical protein